MVTIFVIPHCKQLFIVPWMRKTLSSGDTAHLVLREKGERRTEIEGKKETGDLQREMRGKRERSYFCVRVSDIKKERQVFKWIPTVQAVKEGEVGGRLCSRKINKQTNKKTQKANQLFSVPCVHKRFLCDSTDPNQAGEI